MHLLQPAELHWVSSLMHGIGVRLGPGHTAVEPMRVAYDAAAARARQEPSEVGLRTPKSPYNAQQHDPQAQSTLTRCAHQFRASRMIPAGQLLLGCMQAIDRVLESYGFSPDLGTRWRRAEWMKALTCATLSLMPPLKSRIQYSCACYHQ